MHAACFWAVAMHTAFGLSSADELAYGVDQTRSANRSSRET